MSTTTKKAVCEGDCKHPISFHGSGDTQCNALGCHCQRYVGVTRFGLDTISSDEAAELLGRTKDWVQRNAEKLGGVKVLEAAVRKPKSDMMKSTAQVWRFYPKLVEEFGLDS
jgi:hypothetical protein